MNVRRIDPFGLKNRMKRQTFCLLLNFVIFSMPTSMDENLPPMRRLYSHCNRLKKRVGKKNIAEMGKGYSVQHELHREG